MTKKYHVLWLDDEHESLRNIRNAAYEHDIELRPFTSFEEGFAYLEANLSLVDAVLLDARFFISSTQGAGSEDAQALSNAKARLEQLSNRRRLPFFILSGQERYENNSDFKEAYGQHYRKYSPEDKARLWAAIKQDADKSHLTQLRHRYAEAFAAFSPNHLSEEASKHLFATLAFLHDPNAVGDGEEYFNGLRKVIEALFQAAHRRGLLADECVPKGVPNLQWASLFLGGHTVTYDKEGGRTVSPAGPCFPPRLAESLKDVLKATNALSHLGTETTAARDLLAQTKPYVNTPYLLASLTYQLLDILIWYRAYAIAHPDAAANRAAWVYPPEFTPVSAAPAITKIGRVNNITAAGLGFFLEDGKTDSRIDGHLIPSDLVTHHGLRQNDRIRVTLGTPPTDGKQPKVKSLERY